MNQESINYWKEEIKKFTREHNERADKSSLILVGNTISFQNSAFIEISYLGEKETVHVENFCKERNLSLKTSRSGIPPAVSTPAIEITLKADQIRLAKNAFTKYLFSLCDIECSLISIGLILFIFLFWIFSTMD